MKIFLSSVALLISTALHAGDIPILWSMTALVDLKIDENELLVNVPYPGALGDRSFCGVEILASGLVTREDLTEIGDDLLVRDGFSEVGGLTTLSPTVGPEWPLSYRLASKGTYMTYVWIKAPEGKTLNEYFEGKLRKDSTSVMLHGIRCDDTRFKKNKN